VTDRDAARGRGREVHVVEAHRAAREHPQPRRAGAQLGIDAVGEQAERARAAALGRRRGAPGPDVEIAAMSQTGERRARQRSRREDSCPIAHRDFLLAPA
jgi:hypothetical protein